MKKLWFKAKRYGYGWVPATKEGWLIVLVYVVLFASAEVVFLHHIQYSQNPRDAVVFVAFIGLITTILIWISARYGEPARWRWGDDDK